MIITTMMVRRLTESLEKEDPSRIVISVESEMRLVGIMAHMPQCILRLITALGISARYVSA